MESSHPFFAPRVGKYYKDGWEGFRTLVLGAYVPCEVECRFKKLCCTLDGIRQMDNVCPCYEEHRKGEYADFFRLSNSNIIELETYIDNDGKSPSFSAFTKYMYRDGGFIDEARRTDFWDHVAFCNYLQCFRPDEDTPSYETAKTLYDDCFSPFLTVLKKLNPQRIYVWTEAVAEALKAHRVKKLSYVGKLDMQAIPLYLFEWGDYPVMRPSAQWIADYVEQKSHENNFHLLDADRKIVEHFIDKGFENGYFEMKNNEIYPRNKAAAHFVGSYFSYNTERVTWEVAGSLFNYKSIRKNGSKNSALKDFIYSWGQSGI